MKKKIFGISVIVMAALAGCTKKATIKLPEAEEKLVVTSFITPDDSLITAVVRGSRPKFSTSGIFMLDYDEISDAAVEISGPGRTSALRFDESLQAYFLTAEEFPLVPGESYTMSVSAADGKHVRATTTIPLDTLETIRFTGEISRVETIYSNLDVSCSFEVKDIPGKVNYVAMYHRQTMEMPVDTTWGDDPGFAFFNFGEGVFEDDETESVSSYRGSARWQNYHDTVTSVAIELMVLNCSREFYLYNRSVQQALYAGDNPFGEPVMVFSNVEGGYGCFGAYRSTKRRLELK